MKKTKKSLLFSGLALMMSALLLVGTTFAWFTDSVTNKGNTIQSGNLNVKVVGYTLEDGAWSKPIYENTLASKPLFTETTWEPGQYGAMLLKVSNIDSTLAAKVDIDFDITSSEKNLENALWYNLKAIQTTDGNPLNEILENLQFKDNRPASEGNGAITMSKIEQDETAPVTVYGKDDHSKGVYVYYVLEYGMYTSAGNEYQDGSIEVDFTVKATQAPVEEDGFGNPNYDEDATLPATNNKSLIESLQNGGSVTATGTYYWDEYVAMSGNTKTTLTLADDAVITATKKGILEVNDQSQLTINGNGTLNLDENSEEGYLICAYNDSKVVINSGTYIGGITCVQAGDNAQVEIYGGHFEALVDWGGNYWLLNLVDNTNASIKVYGGTFVNYDPSNSKTESPAANFVADGYKVVSEEKDNGDTWYTVVPED